MLLDTIDRRLLDGWQRDLPLEPRPFARIGDMLNVSEGEVLDRLARFAAEGALSRVGATLRPNTAGASTLAAVAAPEGELEAAARRIAAEPGVNHVYAREDAWNIWFVATGPDRAHVQAALTRIALNTGLSVIDLPLVRPYHIDLGFSLDGTRQASSEPEEAELDALRLGDDAILDYLTQGLDLTALPYRAMAGALGLEEAHVVARIQALVGAGIITRLGLILRHRALGWTANAMVVWHIPEAEVDAAGKRLAAQPGVTLCYRRRPDAGAWPFNLYCMIHARSREEGLETLDSAASGAGIGTLNRRVLFSTRCFKQRGAMVASRPEAAA